MSTRPLFKEVVALIRQVTKITISPNGVVGKIFRKFVYNPNKGGTVRSRILSFLIVAVVAIFPSVASATNGHQDHRGACARSTTSVSKGVSDLAFNGVLTSFAQSIGIHSFDGSLQLQMTHRLTVGVVKKATVTHNEGCDGHGGTFPAGNRTLFKGEKVIVEVPAKFGTTVCTHSHRGCRAVTVKEHVVFPGSCWNRNRGTILVVIWVKVVHHKAKPKPCQCQPAKVVCSNGVVVDSLTQCANQTATQNCEAQGGNSTGDQQTCTSIQIVNQCGNVVVVNGSDNSTGTSQGGNCNTQQPPPPPPSSNAACTGLNVVTDEQVARGVIATVTYQATNTSLQNVRFNWGDNTFSDTGTTLTAKHVYSVANTYTVNAVLTFADSFGNTTSATCSAMTVTPKDGTSGAGSGSGTTGGTGAGGTSGSGTGDTCIDPNTGDVRPLQPGEVKDQFGYCRPA